MADVDNTTDADELLSRGDSQHGSKHKKAVVAAVLASVGLMAGAVVASSPAWQRQHRMDAMEFMSAAKASHKHNGTAHARHSGKAKSKTARALENAAGEWALKASGTECANAEEIRLGGLLQERDAESCQRKCSEIKGCTGFLFSPPTAHGGVPCASSAAPWPGACQPLAGECQQAQGTCYDVYENSAQSEYAWSLRRGNARCKDGDDIPILGSFTVTASAADCGSLCIKTGGCSAFSYKKGNSYVFWGFVQGVCTVYSGDCNFYDDNDWDDYALEKQVPPIQYSLQGEGQGCSNWHKILFKQWQGGASNVEGGIDVDRCALMCQQQGESCTSFGFSEKDQKCYLFNGECEGEAAPDWNNYVVQMN